MTNRILNTWGYGSLLALSACGSAQLSAPIDRPEVVKKSSAAVVIQPSVGGQWSDIIPLNSPVTPTGPVVPIHMTLMKNNRIMLVDRQNDTRSGDAVGASPVAFEWDWSTRTFYAAGSPDAVLWCGGTSTLPDGRLINVGGYGNNGPDSANNLVRIHTPGTLGAGAWTAGQPMAFQRFYATSLTLPNGEVLVSGGTFGTTWTANIPEVASTTGVWRQLNSTHVADTTATWFKYYPWFHVLSDGKVFYSGADYRTYFLDTAGSGSITAGAERQKLVRDYGTSVMYNQDKVLITGGSTPTQNTAGYVDLSSVSTRASAAWQPTPMSYPRKLHNATILPDGKVLVTGGSSVGGDPGGARFEDTWQAQQILGDASNKALDIAVAPFADGRLDVYMIGTDHAIWHRFQDTNLTWQPTTSPNWIRIGTRAASEIAVSRLPNGSAELVMADSTDQTIWHINVPASGTPSGGFLQIGSNSNKAQHVAIAPFADGRLDVYMVGLDNAVWHSRQGTVGGGWLPTGSIWARIGTSVACATLADGTCQKPFSVSRRPDDSSEVVMLDGNQNVVHDWLGSDASDHGFQLVGVASNKGKNIAVAPFGDGRLEVFMIGLDARLWHIWQMPGGASSAASPNGIWHNSSPNTFDPVGSTLVSSISAVRLRDDHSDVYASHLDGNHELLHSNGDSARDLLPVGANGVVDSNGHPITLLNNQPAPAPYVASRIVATPYLSTIGGRKLDSRAAVAFINSADQTMSYVTQEEGPVYASEIWDPVSHTWTLGAAMQVPRTYHSSTVLLPDGTVLSAGGGQGGNEPDHANAEIYKPAYFFTGNPQPQITSAPTVVRLGRQFTVSTNSSNITRVTLLGLGATTHSHNMGQHFNELTASHSGTTLTVTAPPNANVCPPGYYMLFVLANGVPSVAKFVQITN